MSDSTEYTIEIGPVDLQADGKKPCLIMIRGDFIGQVYELIKDVTWLGRSDGVDLVISDPSISRKHAMIVLNADGFYLSDLGSTNGTQLNRKKVTTTSILREGDKIVVGNVVFKFCYQDEDDTLYHKVLRNMAVKDGLTRIYNKRFFDEAMVKEFDYNRRNQSGLALVMFDIDDFKQVNDSRGHPAGDAILKQLAELIENKARGYDVFARVGGEEFVFLMRSASKEAAAALAERVRQVVADHTFKYEDLGLRITISVGVCYWSGNDAYANPEEFVAAVDQKLYEAKDAGRNRVGS
jgi:diguanylate cyclase (GGDEF)-like protein